MSITNSGVANEGFLVIHHGIDGQLFTVLSGNDCDSRLFGLNHFRHLFDYFHLVFILNDSGV